MSRTEQALSKLNDRAKLQVDFFKSHNGEPFASNDKALGYLYALVDCGVITETERRLIFCYITI